MEFIPDSTGVYELVQSIGAGRVLVEKSSAPVGVDLRTDQVFFKVSSLEEIRLPFIVDGSGPFAVAANKITGKTVFVSLENPNGGKSFSSQIKDWTILTADQAKSILGIWTLAIDPAEKGNDSMLRLNLQPINLRLHRFSFYEKIAYVFLREIGRIAVSRGVSP